MKERPILFSSPMVRAILDGRKTQTRRAVRLTDSGRVKEVGSSRNWHLDDPNAILACPYGEIGDRLWVRETWKVDPCYDDCAPRELPERLIEEVESLGNWDTAPYWPVSYVADNPKALGKTRVSIHMPRWASRTTLEITGIRVERLNQISEEDAIKEGADPLLIDREWTADQLSILDLPLMKLEAPHRNGFALLWASINGPGSWVENPYVWVIEFRKIEA